MTAAAPLLLGVQRRNSSSIPVLLVVCTLLFAFGDLIFPVFCRLFLGPERCFQRRDLLVCVNVALCTLLAALSIYFCEGLPAPSPRTVSIFLPRSLVGSPAVAGFIPFRLPSIQSWKDFSKARLRRFVGFIFILSVAFR